ncbi:AraC family transcriptional regulator [Marinoscillum sp. 108]|uniref:helix-turn-helix domain-containing protein n=1 Tax=Marinoscillum sp. 108 TaxID=2653151 RepID=UPI0012EF177A|nr:AraC family transcriptional regulator [Marinoscillum sp. 108]VXD18884.1 Transcriptional regulator, AraC family [Marinoscillum sp. 108]
MEPSLNTWTVIFLIAASQGIFLGVVIWTKRHQANGYLGAVVLAFSLMLLYYVLYWTGYFRLAPRWLGVLQGMTFLLGPLFYGYVRSDERLFRVGVWHFLPFVIYLIHFLVLPFESLELRRVLVRSVTVLQTIHLLIYAGVALRWTWVNALASGRWRIVLSLLFMGYAFSFLLYYVLVWTGLLKIEYDYFISVVAAVFIYSIGYKGYQGREVFHVNTGVKYDRSGLSQSAAEAFLAEVKRYMEEDKGYLNNDLKLQYMADELAISANHISQVVNELEGCNFTDFVNRYRVQEAKRLLQDEAHHYKIIQIAYLAGFNNKATFNSAFKKFVGVPPSQFKKALNRQHPQLQ